MKILIIDNTIDRACWGAKDICRALRQNPPQNLPQPSNVTLYVRRAPECDLPADPSAFDRIIVSGSKTSVLSSAPWISELTSFIQKAVQSEIPFLGICYGHQMLARALGGIKSVRKAAVPEFGWTQISLTSSSGSPSGSPLFAGLPQSFYSYSAHYDEVHILPPGMKNLATSEHCEVQACQLESLPIFGIQFHPERNLSDAERAYQRWKKTKDSPPLAHYAQGKTFYNPKVTETLFRNFLNL